MSVVIPAFNAARFVVDAIASVFAQSYRDFEVILVDDGSTDDTCALVARAYPCVRLLRQENCGVASARNVGIDESRGALVAFLDADDVWLPAKLAKQVTALSAAPAGAVAYSPFVEVDEGLGRERVVHKPLGRRQLLTCLLLRGNVVGTPSTVVAPRSTLLAVGGFATNLSQCADWDLWIRLARRFPFVCVDEPLVKYRRHCAAMSRDVGLLERDSELVLHRAFVTTVASAEARRLKRLARGRNYGVLAGSYFHAGDWRGFARCAARAVWLSPRQAAHVFAFPLRLASRLLKRV